VKEEEKKWKCFMESHDTGKNKSRKEVENEEEK